ncbi:MAG: hypothetical protein ABL878_00815 [Burkholderiales bacterium]
MKYALNTKAHEGKHEGHEGKQVQMNPALAFLDETSFVNLRVYLRALRVEEFSFHLNPGFSVKIER